MIAMGPVSVVAPAPPDRQVRQHGPGSVQGESVLAQRQSRASACGSMLAQRRLNEYRWRDACVVTDADQHSTGAIVSNARRTRWFPRR